MKYYHWLRKCLFLLPPELAHTLSLKALRFMPAMPSVGELAGNQTQTIMSLDFSNPIGLAAGLDKNGDYIDSLAKLGFGFIEVGTVTPRPQQGNPKPRLRRLIGSESLINRMGFNNKGVHYLVDRLKKTNYNGIIGVNIGKNANTPLQHAIEDYKYCFEHVYPYASYVTINISSPNTEGLRELQEEAQLRYLLERMRHVQIRLEKQFIKHVPMLVKIAPDISQQDVQDISKVILEQGIEGIILTNTSKQRHGVTDPKFQHELGGLSGKLIETLSTNVIKQFREVLPENFPIIGVGGIDSPEGIAAKRAAGANLFQVYTGLIYQGPGLIKRLVRNIKHYSPHAEHDL